MIQLKEMTAREIIPGYLGKFIHGEKSTLAIWEIKAGSVMPEHAHLHEQITFIMDGELEMIIGGIKYQFTTGMSHVIPSNTPHSAIAVRDSKVIDSFAPSRDDYR